VRQRRFSERRIHLAPVLFTLRFSAFPTQPSLVSVPALAVFHHLLASTMHAFHPNDPPKVSVVVNTFLAIPVFSGLLPLFSSLFSTVQLRNLG
jgi:hypothetical protein